jgi:hypothetical protein
MANVERAAGGVLKKDATRPAGAQPVGTGVSPAQKADGGVQARIVEQADGVATVEVTCLCGRKTYVQCFYGQQQT